MKWEAGLKRKKENDTITISENGFGAHTAEGGSMRELYIGLDGGGTRTSAAAVRRDGSPAGKTQGGGLNYLQDGLAVCLDRFESMTRELIGKTPPEQVLVTAGLAALDGPAEEEVLRAFRERLPEGCGLELQSDAHIALMGHTAGGPGMMVICGTGSMLMAMDAEGKEHVLGGWGWKMGDAGSGYTLARNALAQAAENFDLTGNQNAVLQEALTFFSAETPRGLIPKLYDPGMGTEKTAAFGAVVLRLAEAGDTDARSITEQEMERLAALAEALKREVPEAAVCAMYGGVFGHSALARQLFAENLGRRCPDVQVTQPRHRPEIGAVVCGMLRDGLTAAEIACRLERGKEQ
ncbi:MAG: hypothetical protein IJL88_08885 [Clostridia bacterium]|nr:hypothetical protein [Clostridia bacterium]